MTKQNQFASNLIIRTKENLKKSLTKALKKRKKTKWRIHRDHKTLKDSRKSSWKKVDQRENQDKLKFMHE